MLTIIVLIPLAPSEYMSRLLSLLFTAFDSTGGGILGLVKSQTIIRFFVFSFYHYFDVCCAHLPEVFSTVLTDV